MRARKSTKSKRAAEPRFSECMGCEFFRVGNTHRQCGGCDAGENFEQFVDELDPDTDAMFGEDRGHSDE